MKRFFDRELHLIKILTLILLVLSSVAISYGITFTVTKIADTNDNVCDADCSLREAVTLANYNPTDDIIAFDPTVFAVSQTIILTGGEIGFTSNGTFTINGTGADLLAVSGNHQSRIFFSNYGNARISINNLTLKNGKAPGGGAIHSSAIVNLTRVVISGNTSMGNTNPNEYTSYGGGIYNGGDLTVTDSIIINNSAVGIVRPGTSTIGNIGDSAGGGGIYANGFNTTLINCVVTNNTARGADSANVTGNLAAAGGGYGLGGGINSVHGIKIINSTISNNSAVGGRGGSADTAFFAAGDGGNAIGGGLLGATKMLNSTVVNNTAVGGTGGTTFNLSQSGKGGTASGGGLYAPELRAANATIVNNSVTGGSGRIGGSASAGGIFGSGYQWSVVNSTVTGNSVIRGSGFEGGGASQGGGIFNGANSDQSAFYNTIIAENSAEIGRDVFGTFSITANNLVGNGDGSNGFDNGVNGNLIGTYSSPIDPRLAPLANNGGITQTRALLSNSSAINNGNAANSINPLTAQPLTFDQRGLQRVTPTNTVQDIGAFEFGASSVPTLASPDLQNASDTGISDTDNVTKAAIAAFDITGAIPGATVELLRNNTVIAAATVSSANGNVSLSDLNPPSDGIVLYSSRQTIGGVVSSLSSTLSVTFDNTSPTVTINQSATQIDPATSMPIRFTVVFSEPAGGLEPQDISLVGSTADVSSAFKFINSVNSTTYTVEVYGVQSPGQVVATVLPSAAYDQVLNYSSASTSTDNSIYFQPNIIAVNIAGRIVKNSTVRKGLTIITFTDNQTGEKWSARTNPFGYYRIIGVPVYQQIGKKFAVKISGKTFTHTPTSPVTITDNISNLNFNVP